LVESQFIKLQTFRFHDSPTDKPQPWRLFNRKLYLKDYYGIGISNPFLRILKIAFKKIIWYVIISDVTAVTYGNYVPSNLRILNSTIKSSGVFLLSAMSCDKLLLGPLKILHILFTKIFLYNYS